MTLRDLPCPECGWRFYKHSEACSRNVRNRPLFPGAVLKGRRVLNAEAHTPLLGRLDLSEMAPWA